MRIVNLHGKIAERFGARWELEVDSIVEALRAIDANTGNFFDYLSENRQENKTFSFILDGCSQKIERKEELLTPIPKQCREFHIIPNAEGATGVELFVVNLVIALASSFIMKALFKPPKPEDEKRSRSFLFGGAENVAAQAIPVPLGYGRLLVGSVTVSSTMRHIDRDRIDDSLLGSFAGGGHHVTYADYWDPRIHNLSRLKETVTDPVAFDNSDPEGVFSLKGGN
tara:strand:+ start:9787 stop:10464 length:678 start_codon:yes stop_codon:yes gene_type:complete